MTAPLSLRVLTRPEEVARLAPAWNRRVLTERPSLYLTYEWVDSLWQSHFGHAGASFLCLERDGAFEGIVPVTSRAVRKGPLTFRHRGLVTNSYGRNHNDLVLLGDREAAFRLVLERLAQEGWDVWLLGSIPEESPTPEMVGRLAGPCRYRVVTEPYAVSPYLTLEGDWETFLKGRSSNFRQDLKRKWNKARDLSPEFRTFTRPEEVEAYLTAAYVIEEGSWKEGSGTSITTQPSARRFYDVFLPRAAANGWFRGVVLYLGGEPAAHDMGVLLDGKYYMLKTSYTLRHREKSPGIVLRQHVVQDLFARGAREHDFLGDDEEWKMRWTGAVRRHANLYLYNGRSLRASLYATARDAIRGRRASGSAGR